MASRSLEISRVIQSSSEVTAFSDMSCGLSFLSNSTNGDGRIEVEIELAKAETIASLEVGESVDFECKLASNMAALCT
jgi:hypothetical protein